MKTQTKKRPTVAAKQRVARKSSTAEKQTLTTETKDEKVLQELIPLNQIVFSPFNYRKWYDPKALDEFATAFRQHGVISPITIRPLENGYELVAGERRVKAARLAGLTTIPAVVKNLTDQEVKDIQLSENIHREDVHPFYEAQAIANLLSEGASIEEVALRLGKSKAFIYNRMKLANLIEPLSMVFMANKITIQDAFEIAKLSTEAQQDLFNEHFEGEWEEDDFEMDDLNYILRRYLYDLHNAPFDTEDKHLIPAVGACTGCPFNSAAIKSLFPEMAKEAICSNKSCYKSKSQAHTIKQAEGLLKENIPEAIISASGNIPEGIPELLKNTTGKDLPLYSSYDIEIITPPEKPDMADYTVKDEEKETLDEDAYQSAMQEYEAAMQEHEAEMESGRVKIGLHFKYQAMEIVFFNPEKKKSPLFGSKVVTAKEVQEAIKDGTVTQELLEAEITRLNTRETRLKELDAEKIQKRIYDEFAATCGDNDTHSNWELTKSDLTAIKLLVFQCLGFRGSDIANFLFLSSERAMKDNNLFELLANIGERELCYLIRKVVAGKSETKNPKDILGYAMYKMAESAGLDVVTIEQEQQAIAEERERKLSLRIKDVESRIQKMNNTVRIDQAE